jgi:hypothetical protein
MVMMGVTRAAPGNRLEDQRLRALRALAELPHHPPELGADVHFAGTVFDALESLNDGSEAAL